MKTVNRFAMLLLVLAWASFTVAAPSGGKDGAADGAQEAIMKAVMNRIKVQAVLVESEAVRKVVALPVYDVTITIAVEGGYQATNEKAIVDGKTVITLPELISDMKVDGLAKIIDRKFKLTTATTKDFEALLDVLYPARDKSQKEVAVKGTQFTFIRGKFFDSKTGFIVTTDASGAITDVSYSLNIK